MREMREHVEKLAMGAIVQGLSVMTTHDLAHETGNGHSTITRWCRELGYTKIGRDWHLTPEQAERVIAAMYKSRGRPRKSVDRPNSV